MNAREEATWQDVVDAQQRRIEGLQAKNAALKAGNFERQTSTFTYAQAAALCQKWEPRARLVEMFALPGALRAAEVAHCSAAVAAECNRTLGTTWHDAVDGVRELTAERDEYKAAAEERQRIRVLVIVKDKNGNVAEKHWQDEEGA